MEFIRMLYLLFCLSICFCDGLHLHRLPDSRGGLYRMLRPEDPTERHVLVPTYSKLLADFLGTRVLVLTASLNLMTESEEGSLSSLAVSCA